MLHRYHVAHSTSAERRTSPQEARCGPPRPALTPPQPSSGLTAAEGRRTPRIRSKPLGAQTLSSASSSSDDNRDIDSRAPCATVLHCRAPMHNKVYVRLPHQLSHRYHVANSAALREHDADPSGHCPGPVLHSSTAAQAPLSRGRAGGRAGAFRLAAAHRARHKHPPVGTELQHQPSPRRSYADSPQPGLGALQRRAPMHIRPAKTTNKRSVRTIIQAPCRKFHKQSGTRHLCQYAQAYIVPPLPISTASAGHQASMPQSEMAAHSARRRSSAYHSSRCTITTTCTCCNRTSRPQGLPRKPPRAPLTRRATRKRATKPAEQVGHQVAPLCARSRALGARIRFPHAIRADAGIWEAGHTSAVLSQPLEKAAPRTACAPCTCFPLALACSR